MQTEQERTVLAHNWGIDLSYKDALGAPHHTSTKTIDAILGAMKADPDKEAPPDCPVLLVRRGATIPIKGGGTITLESGGEVRVTGGLPIDLPLGYHSLLEDGVSTPRRLIVGPSRCWLPDQLNTWGWAVQLYAARSRESWGMGDLADLEKLAAWSAKQGAGMMLVNPLSAAIPLAQQQASPYYPSSRRFLNPLWLHIESIPGANDIPDVTALAEKGRALNDDRKINRDRVYELKMKALNAIWLRFEGDDEFSTYCERQGQTLETYATYCALVEEYGSGWREWRKDLQHPTDKAVLDFANYRRSRVSFHKWLQWLIDQQMARCNAHLALMQDLPIGVDPDGADSWAWQDVMASGVTVGAPPDEFNTKGQNWGLPPFVPHKLRQCGYEPFIQTVRAALRNTGGLRVDHVMGLFRLFWIPEGMQGDEGSYVRYTYEDLLTILALESERARAYVVGEDLGTVEEEVREQLKAHSILSYRLLWFEKDDPKEFPREALAAITTHDLPTVAGLWSGADLERQKKLGLQPNEESTREIHERLYERAGLREDDTMAQVIEKAYQLLAQAPCRILTAALDDGAQVEERPNVPATTIEENWSLALPMPIEELMQAELPQRIAKALRRD